MCPHTQHTSLMSVMLIKNVNFSNLFSRISVTVKPGYISAKVRRHDGVFYPNPAQPSPAHAALLNFDSNLMSQLKALKDNENVLRLCLLKYRIQFSSKR